MEKTPAGKFIVLDGPDGCGKSTQCELLDARLRKERLETVRFRDPGTTGIGEKIRQILLDAENIAMTAEAEVLLYMAARVQLWHEQIEPALKSGKTVILDRWLSSTCAYQGYAGGFGIGKVISIAENSLPRIWPDLTVILDLDVETGLGRLRRPPDRIEAKEAAYHEKVREGFLQLARLTDRFAVLDAGKPVETVQEAVLDAIQARLGLFDKK